MAGSSLTLHTTVAPMGPAAALLLTDHEVETLGGGKRAAVVVTIGPHTARLRVAVMGGQAMIGLSKASRAALGVSIGDEVTATIAVDHQPRDVDIPPELAEALADHPQAADAFHQLAYTHRREYAQWVSEAKRAETRAKRAAQAIERLSRGGRSTVR